MEDEIDVGKAFSLEGRGDEGKYDKLDTYNEKGGRGKKKTNA